MSADLQSLLTTISNRLGAIEAHLGINGGSASSGSASHGSATELPRSIKGYDSYYSSTVTPFVEVCTKLGDDAALLGAAVKAAWDEQRNYLLLAAHCKAPTKEVMMQELTKVSNKMKEVAALTKRNVWEKHGKTCSEGVQCLNWLAVSPAPRDFIDSFIGGSDYWANNIRKEFRTTNPDQVAFCDRFKSILVELMAYVKEFHTTGVAWNPKGVDVTEYLKTGGSAAASSPAPISAPVSAPTAPAPAAAAKAPAAPAGAPPVNIFAELSKGGAVTSTLKTVTKDMQTWRAEYKGGDAPAPKAVVPKAAARPADQVKGTPKVEFVAPQSKWMVHYQSAVNGVVTVEVTEKRESVYIFGCIGATIKVVGKCNGIVIDTCKRCNVTVDNVMAALETVNSQIITLTINEKASSVAIDKTDGFIVTLPKSSLDTNIVTSKSSEMNVQWYDETDTLIERPIPEQYQHKIDLHTKNITAQVSDLYTH